MRSIHFGFAVGPINCARVFVTLWALELDGARLYVLGKQTERQLRPLQQRRILGGADQRSSSAGVERRARQSCPQGRHNVRSIHYFFVGVSSSGTPHRPLLTIQRPKRELLTCRPGDSAGLAVGRGNAARCVVIVRHLVRLSECCLLADDGSDNGGSM